MKLIWTLAFAAFLTGGVCTAQAQRTDVLQRAWDNGDAANNQLFTLGYNNPAIRYDFRPTTLNTLHIGGDFQKEDQPSIVQMGDGWRKGRVEANSFIHKGNNSLWGKAAYSNGKETGFLWNETSDYALLYPYVMGDTLGGSRKAEHYYFMGGYARQISHYRVGVEGSYEAKLEYRNADPRPKNLTGDLKVRLGASRDLPGAYVLGAALYARKYKQTNDLVFYDELGVPNIYHFTGLGNDYYRFRGAKGESFYKGHAFGGSIDLMPGSQGATAVVNYTNFQFDKVISSLNELPMASVNEHQVNAELGWKSTTQESHKWGVTGTMNFTRRKGTENIFGDAASNIYQQISSAEKYQNSLYRGTLQGVYEQSLPQGWRWSVLPHLGFVTIKTRYAYPRSEMDVKWGNAGSDVKVDVLRRRWLVSATAGVDYRFCPSSSLSLPEAENAEKERLAEPVRDNFEALRQNRLAVHTSLQANYAIKSNYALYLSLSYGYAKDQRPSHLHQVSAQLGILF